MKISVRLDKSVNVSYPYIVTEKEVLSFLSRSELWILQQQKNADLKRKKFSEGSVIKTKLHAIELLTAPYTKIDVINDVIKLYAPEFDSDRIQQNIEKLITKIYR